MYQGEITHLRIRRFAGGTALATIAASVTLLAGPGTAQAQDSIVLPVTSHWQTLVDSRHVYVSAPGQDAVVATDHNGQVIRTVEGLDGARGMTQTADESRLYVALPEADAIAEIDTTTLTETRRFPTGTDTEPENLAFAGGRLWFSYQATVFDGGIGSVAVAETTPTVDLDDNPVWYGKPRLASSPGAPDRLVAAESAGGAGMRVYDVASGSAEEIAHTDGVGDVEDLAVAPDGRSAITANGGTYYHQRWALPDLAEEGTYDTGAYPNAVSIAPDGTVAAGVRASGDWDIFVYRPGETTPFRTVSLNHGHMELLERGVAWTPDGSRLFGTRFPYSGEVVLDIITDVHKANSNIALTAPRTHPHGQPVTVSGKLTSPVPFPRHKVVTVTRHNEPIATVKVKPDGSFAFTDLPADYMRYPEYVVTYAGDATHVPGTATVTVEIVS
ncbi:hypothetical protein GCM10010266_31340 [Streptomyces griseomycini]|nr:hypothetical protein GCM10010266_31340 [Streptomyces griseomycini]GGR21028.1 hypothetical protein GCM10015536_28290 [Streptomyces griseomycini]